MSIPPSEPSHSFAWLAEHPALVLWAGVGSLAISIRLMIGMWMKHRGTSLFKKAIWSLILLLPLFGWVFYAGGFNIPNARAEGLDHTVGTGGAPG